MNIHPIIVHFPIALLTLYALVELVTVFYQKHHDKVFAIKSFLLIIGWLGSTVAIKTGKIAREVNGGPPELLRAHETFANTTVLIFGILALVYVLHLIFIQNIWGGRVWLDRARLQQKVLLGFVDTVIGFVRRLMENRWLLGFLALCGLAIITVTGALGGAIVRGVSADPIIEIVTHVLGVR